MQANWDVQSGENMSTRRQGKAMKAAVVCRCCCRGAILVTVMVFGFLIPPWASRTGVPDENKTDAFHLHRLRILRRAREGE